MKEGWEEKRLGELITLEYGKPLPKEMRDPNGKYPVYGANGAISRSNDYYSEGYSIIIGRKGSAGEINYSENKFWPLDVTYFTKFDTKIIDLNFLFYLLSLLNLPKFAKGVKPGINRNDIYNIQILLPSLSEQKEIVAILDEAFAAIDTAQANIEKNIANANELFQSRLNEIFSRKGDGWEEKNLQDISTEFGRGKSKHRPRNDKILYGGKYPFVQTGDIRNADKIINSYTQTYNNVGLAQSKLWPKGTICITIAANIAETAILEFDSCFPDSVIGLIVDSNKADRDYTYYSLQFLKRELQAQGKGSAQDNINLGTFQNQLFPFPKLQIQKEIANNLDDFKKQIEKICEKYHQKLSNLEDLKQSLLQKAFAGELT